MFKKDLRKEEDFFPKIVFWQSKRRTREDCEFRIYNTTNKSSRNVNLKKT
jgi:hypothetical protein